jgi:hypothetical protein
MLPIGFVFGLMMTFLVNARSRALVAEDQDKWSGKSNRVMPKQFLPEAPAALRNQSGTSGIRT